MKLIDQLLAALRTRFRLVAILLFAISLAFSREAQADKTLTINQTGDGYGTVNVFPAPLSQNGNEYTYPDNEEVGAYALAKDGSLFWAWTGDFDEDHDSEVVVYMNANKTIQVEFKFNGGPNVSAAQGISPFTGYSSRVTSTKFEFESGKEFVDGLIDITTEYGGIKNLFVFSHGWEYQSQFGAAHDGGFVADTGAHDFYGQTLPTDDADARDVGDLRNAVSSDSIKFVTPTGQAYANGARNQLFFEGCHVYEIGGFALAMKGVTDCHTVAPCGICWEEDIGSGYVIFGSGAENFAESQDPDYDGFRKRKADDNSQVDLGSTFEVP